MAKNESEFWRGYFKTGRLIFGRRSWEYYKVYPALNRYYYWHGGCWHPGVCPWDRKLSGAEKVGVKMERTTEEQVK